MARRVFYSFHYKPDCWRASKIRNIGTIEGNKPATDNEWESVTRGGDTAIERWIKEQMKGRTCAVVLIGESTAGRKWIKHEIVESWKQGLGLLGIHIHNITDQANQQANKGANPFAEFDLNGKPFSSIVKTYDPPFRVSSEVYAHIAARLESWIDEAIRIRAGY
jgi:MTH538 TIR-like domain (DUF1863)